MSPEPPGLNLSAGSLLSNRSSANGSEGGGGADGGLLGLPGSDSSDDKPYFVIFNCMFGFVANSFIIAMFVRERLLRVNENLFLFCLAFVDNVMIVLISIRSLSLIIRVDLLIVPGICPLRIYLLFMNNFLVAWLIFAYTTHQLRAPPAGASERVRNYKYAGLIGSMVATAVVFYFHFLWIMALGRSDATRCHVLTEWVAFFNTWRTIDASVNGIVPYVLIFLFGWVIALRHLHHRWTLCRAASNPSAHHEPGASSLVSPAGPRTPLNHRAAAARHTKASRGGAQANSHRAAVLAAEEMDQRRHTARRTTPHASAIRFVLPLFAASACLPRQLLSFWISTLGDNTPSLWRTSRHLSLVQQSSHALKLFLYLAFYPNFRRAFRKLFCPSCRPLRRRWRAGAGTSASLSDLAAVREATAAESEEEEEEEEEEELALATLTKTEGGPDEAPPAFCIVAR